MPTVLIVEDEPDIRATAENALGDAGYQTFAAHDAAEALAILRDHPEVDLLLADTHLGGPTSGVGLVRAAKHMRPDLKVLYSTNRIDELLGPDSTIEPTHILRKPYQPIELRQAVGWLLQPSV